jgi:hypothetical protein
MVGTTGIEPVTPTMSTRCVDGNYKEISRDRPANVRKRSRLDHGNLGHSLGRADRAFEPLAHTVYEGRSRLGRYELVQVSPVKRYAAYDARNRLLGRFQTRKAAWAAIRRAAAKGGRR